MQRRQILAAATALPLLASGTRLLAAAPGTPRVLVVFLRGAYDAASLLVPVGSSLYYETRPNIAIARPGSGPNAAIALDADWGLHPALAGTLLPLWQRRQLAFVPFAGSDDLSRSHFETQDSIELGQPLGGSRDYRSGFLNRLAQVLGVRDAIAFTEQLPLVLRGSVDVPNLGLAADVKPAFDARQSALIAGMYEGSALQGAVQRGFAVRGDAARDLAGGGYDAEMAAASRNAITAKGFEGQARRVARLMRQRYHLGFIDVGGWDTHVGQGGATGTLATRLTELGTGLAAFADEMGSAWDRTTVVVISEFGRTFRENGNRGTDHGHGSVYWVLGGNVAGGQVRGEQVAVTAATLNQNRDYPVLNEVRGMLAGLFTRLYGLSAAQSQQVFAGVAPRDLGLV